MHERGNINRNSLEIIESEEYTYFLLLKKHLLEAAKKESISVEQLSVEKVFEICKPFEKKAVLSLIHEQIPYPSKDPKNDLVYKLRLVSQAMIQEEYAGT